MGRRVDWRMRFWGNTRKSDGCWEWQRALDRDGYGALKVGGAMKATHRLSWILHYGEIPGELCVLHHCDNRKCVRPDHLFLGTRVDNAKDRDAKGRHQKGEQMHTHKLTGEQVQEIRRTHARGALQVDIGSRFGVSPSQICAIVNNKAWTHIKSFA